MTKVNPKTMKNVTTGFVAGVETKAAPLQNAEQLLRRAVLASLLWENLAYESGDENANNIAELIPQVDPEKVYKIAVEARFVQKLRHVPLFIAVQMLKHPNHRVLVSKLLQEIIVRADQVTDTLAIYKTVNKKLKPLASQLKNGLATVITKFDDYQIGKYKGDGADISMIDAINLIHPKPTPTIDRLMNGKLEAPETWEVNLSAGKDKKETFTNLINDNKLGALAFLRNLRNMVESGVDKKVIAQGFKNVKSTMLLPLNFYSAAKHAPLYLREIEDLMFRCYSDIKKLPGHTAFIVDLSGSMNSPVSSKSTFTRKDVACVMASLAAELCERVTIVGTSGNANTHKSQIVPALRGFGLVNELTSLRLGGGGIFTNQAIDWLKEQPGCAEFDRIIVFSDSQDIDVARGQKVKKPYGKTNYICDVSSHKHGINYKGVWTAEISGWSEHFLTYVSQYEGFANSFETAEDNI